MKLRDLGEFDLIERMSRIFGQPGAVAAPAAAAFVRPAVGIGDDAAVWENRAGSFTIATSDAMIEGVHFTASTAGWYDLGWRAMASNISDIAGMGGIPRYALVALAARGEQEVDDILDICRGMADLATRYGALVIGGDTVSSPLTMLTITLIGETVETPERGQRLPPFLSRSEARPGDLIAVTGVLGSSAGGLELLLKGNGVVSESYFPLAEVHRRPVPRVAEGQWLVEAGVRCGMDLSDGLAGDLARVCRASGVAAVVEPHSLPIDPLLETAFGERSTDLALSGGEDYELLCTAPAEVISAAQLLLRSRGARLTVVGRIVEPEASRPPVMLIGRDGKLYPPARSGWEHFSVGGNAAGQ